MTIATQVTQEVHDIPFADLVGELVDMLGGPNVALIGGVSRTSAVAAWRRGTPPKSEERANRLRLACQMARILATRYDTPTVRAWFWAAKEQFEDEAPIALLAEGDLLKVQASLLGAARQAIATSSVTAATA